ncbi:MAG: methionine adenosyltransferase [Bacteroidales bacterium]|nr:methionine adenosyltransferase [Bacteroidales bacterium]
MKNLTYQMTSESVSEGHPDKLADQISDTILDAYLEQDADSKVACETFVTHKGVIIAGEIHSEAKISKKQLAALVRRVIEETGYTHDLYGYDPEEIWIKNYLHQQSKEIREGVDLGGAGDQGMMFGYACDETKALMPLPIFLAHRIVERLALLRKNGSIPWLLPDAKSQVTINYEGDKPTGIDNVLVSTQHMPFMLSGGSSYHGSGMMRHGHYSGGAFLITEKMIRETVIERVVKPLLKEYGFADTTKFTINPSGSFTIGGPAADTGLTGRKIIVDTYGGSCPHGGGAFSGKDPSKVDRSGAYMMRYVAKHIVAAGLASRCTTMVSYAIGKADHTALYVNMHGTGKVSEARVIDVVSQLFDLTPRGIIETLQLKHPIYRKTAAYGHFGRDGFKWEELNQETINELRGLA